MAMSRMARMAIMANSSRNGGNQRNDNGGNYRRDGGGEYQRGEYRGEGRGYQRGIYDEMGGDYGTYGRERYDARERGMKSREGMRRGRDWEDDDEDYAYTGGRKGKHGAAMWAEEDEEIPDHIEHDKAEAWVKKMGGKWTMQQTEQVRLQHCPDCNAEDFYAVINMMASDYSKTAQKFGIDRPDFYASLTKDFLSDADAKKGKVTRYMKAIAKL